MILPWTYGPRQFPVGGTDEQIKDFQSPQVSIYRDPADPSWDYMPSMAEARGKCSYVANMQVFNGAMTFPMSIPDGTSNTIGFAEHYFMCIMPGPGATSLDYTSTFSAPPIPVGGRRATFADQGWLDVVPVTDPATKRTVASVPGKTFQVRPRVEEVDHRIPQTPHPGGLPVALFDGSVRTLSPSIDEHIFWSLVTPNGGEVIGDF
jgi:prepilin-type processing-associated H-X9-DG protein